MRQRESNFVIDNVSRCAHLGFFCYLLLDTFVNPQTTRLMEGFLPLTQYEVMWMIHEGDTTRHVVQHLSFVADNVHASITNTEKEIQESPT